MLLMKKTSLVILIGFFVLSACVRENAAPAPAHIATVPAFPTRTPDLPFPTPSSTGDTVLWKTLHVTMDRLEITQEYVTDFGSTRLPPADTKFLWVHLILRNSGQTVVDLPAAEHFSILYAEVELKPSYGHRQDYTDLTTLDSSVFPDQTLDGWLRFDIPSTAEVGDLRFVFLPESAQVGTSYNSPNYPYSENKPTYVWNCAP